MTAKGEKDLPQLPSAVTTTGPCSRSDVGTCIGLFWFVKGSNTCIVVVYCGARGVMHLQLLPRGTSCGLKAHGAVWRAGGLSPGLWNWQLTKSRPTPRKVIMVSPKTGPPTGLIS